MKKFAFTICAKNYIGLAQALEKSIEKYNSDVTFLIFVADEFDGDYNTLTLPPNVLVAKDKLTIPHDEWFQMAFKYDLTEFCTSIKPYCFKYIFNEYQPSACIYFDPDILVFNTLDTIYNQLSDYSIMVTPHITTIEENYTGTLNERNLLYSGMFNLGFLALKNDEVSVEMINWWAIRLKDRCYQNMMENYFTDQKWIDFLPSFYPRQLLISTNLGYNVAPWNFYERRLFETGDGFFIQNRIKKSDIDFPLTFVHFSGFNYKGFLQGEFTQQNIKNLQLPKDFNIVFAAYAEALKDIDISRFINLSYTYNYFSNQNGISIVYRRLFRRLLEDGKVKTNPFDAGLDFYKALKDGGLISNAVIKADKNNVSNVSNIESKTIKVNKFLKLLFRVLGAERFFMLTRLLRLYSKPENHIYLIDKNYLKSFKIWN